MFALGRAVRDRDWRTFLAITLGLTALVIVLIAGVAGMIWFRDHVEWTWGWWLDAYLLIGAVLGAIGTLVAFIAAWIWCVSEARFWGFLLGWLPSAFAAALLGLVLLFLWGPALLVLAIARA